MTSRSCTYFRSVSTSSLMILTRAPPGSTDDAARELSEVSDSVDARAEGSLGDAGGVAMNKSSGNWSTSLITSLTT